jgi:hypothetical protein
MASDQELLGEISSKLDILIRLVAAGVGEGLSLAERAPVLQRAGLDRNVIAAVCNSTPEAVSVRLAEAKRKTRKKKA